MNVQHIDPRSMPLSLAIALFGAGVGDATGAATNNSFLEYAAQLGVTGACAVVAWFLLRRSDTREAAAQKKGESLEEKLFTALERERDLALKHVAELEAQLRSCREERLAT